MFFLSPWNASLYTYSISQLNLAVNHISKLEIITLLSIINLSQYALHLNIDNCTSKYNPKVYLGKIDSTAIGWIYDGKNGEDITKLRWPESLEKNNNSP